MAVDKFGRPQKIIKLTVRERNGRERFPSGMIRIAGKAYKVELSPAKKDGVAGWLVFTELRNQPNSFGGGAGYRSGGNTFQGPRMRDGSFSGSFG